MCDWAEAISAEGKKFYYHKISRISVWEKPEELKIYEASNTGSSNNQTSSASSSASISNLPPSWKEYTTPEGKKYYHNEITKETKWDLPTNGNSSSASHDSNNNNNNNSSSNISPKLNSSNSSISNSSNGKDKERDSKDRDSNSGSSANDQVLDSKDNAIKVFKELLSDNEVASNWSFERAQKAIINDERYQVLKTMSERKVAFQDYLVDRKKYEMEEKRKREKKNREDFIKLLKESPEVTMSMSWRRAQLYFDGDPKWDAVESEKEREDLFRGYMSDLDRKEKDDREQTKREQLRQLRLKFENNPTINIKSQWRKVKDEYETDPLIMSMDKFDVLTCYENYIKDLEKKEEEMQRKDRERLKREARKHRLLFREFLNEKYTNGELHAATKWKSFFKKFNTLPVFENLSTQTTGSTPLELFTDFQEEMEDNYEKDFKHLKDIVRDLDYKFTPNTTLETLKSQLSKHDKYKYILPANFPPFLLYLEEREEKKQRETEKKRKESISNFKVLLEETKSINKHSTWNEIRSSLEGSPDFERLEDEKERESIFNQYIDYLSNEESDEEGIIKSDEGEGGSRRETFSSKKRVANNEDSDRKKKKERSNY